MKKTEKRASEEFKNYAVKEAGIKVVKEGTPDRLKTTLEGDKK